MSDVVYFAERNGLIKIGTTGGLGDRVGQLDKGDCAVPGVDVSPVRVLATMPGSREVERAVHEMFANLCYQGEWFLLAEPLIGFIQAVSAAEAVARAARGDAATPWRYVRGDIVPRRYRTGAADDTDPLAIGLSDLVTLRDAVMTGLVPWTLIAARHRIKRSMTPPTPTGTAGSAFTYRPADLTAWVDAQRAGKAS